MALLTNISSEAMLLKAASAHLRLTAQFLTEPHRGLIRTLGEDESGGPHV